MKAIKKHLAEQLHIANAADYPHKSLFYDMKKQILKRYGKFEGYALQTIEKKCWSCHGTGIYTYYEHEYGQIIPIYSEPCIKCHNGIYSTTQHTLEQYSFGGQTYFIPMKDIILGVKYVTYINGKITHELSYTTSEGFRAMMNLMAWISPWQWMQIKTYPHRCKIVMWWNQSLRKLNWTTPNNPIDELPF